ncbi:MAG: HAD-IA family hydrolase [Alphaproteobacteria bacterium]|nr:HAD-IA family hydrolase [Alphaproteobacteria bacterium]MBE8220443.1 HAD-IA family hydrolase [Alphaproteobacteria bacterium]
MRLVVFDCDGTLVDSQRTIISATEGTLNAFAVPPPPRRDILYAVGLPIEVAMRRHAPNVSDAVLENIVAEFKVLYHDLSQQMDKGQIMYPNTRDLICDLAAIPDTLLAIVTMKSRRGLERVVDVYEIGDFFHSLKTADDGVGKPAPDLLLAAMAECGVDAADTIMVGDTSFDMLMAKAAGTKAYGVAWGYQDVDELQEAGADAIADTPEALRQLLDLPEAL